MRVGRTRAGPDARRAWRAPGERHDGRASRFCSRDRLPTRGAAA